MRAYDIRTEARKSQLLWKGAMFDTGNVGVFLGMDVGKSAHHGHGSSRSRSPATLAARSAAWSWSKPTSTVSPAVISSLPHALDEEHRCAVKRALFEWQ
ncbi:hypothetical protein [Streptomyces colonosanans]|uniref:Uncharacterized protein n=1 Tax=Streptomyces colonosanans TaxID=1428652 RepID=A0A1S2PIQ4_9ACTN|nr:hypothetical protein [Streptomyces colonosanans]OIJ93265.1 hypothetical protein BIV24_12180 [Streptomyces colonosanans]